MENILHVVFSTRCLFVWVLIKMLKPLIGPLKKQGIRIIIYLDDFLLMAPTKDILSYQVTLTVTLLEMFGFVVNYQKSNPTQSVEVLGFPINSITLNISLPLKYQKRVSESCGKSRHQDKRLN